MKKMEELIQNHARVWFYLKDRETKKQFVKEMTAMGCCYLNGDDLTLDNCYHIMALHQDRRLAQVMVYIWNASFEGAIIKPTPIRADYAKLSADDPDWECAQSNFETIQLPMSMSGN